MTTLLASILGCDLNRVHDEIARVEPYVDGLHFDIADGHFVPNITFGEPLLRELKTKLPVDVHLMVTNPRHHIRQIIDLQEILRHEYMTPPFPKEEKTESAPLSPTTHDEDSRLRRANGRKLASKAVANKGGRGDSTIDGLYPLRPEGGLPTISTISFHIETDEDPLENIHLIKQTGLRAGIAIKAETPVEALASIIHEVDYVIIMTIVTGFSGNPFLPEPLEKISWIREKNPDAKIIVDGGVDNKTIAQIRAAGVDSVISGHYLFTAPDVAEAAEILRG